MIDNKELVGSMEWRTHCSQNRNSGIARISELGEWTVLLDSGMFENEFSKVAIRCVTIEQWESGY